MTFLLVTMHGVGGITNNQIKRVVMATNSGLFVRFALIEQIIKIKINVNDVITAGALKTENF